MSIEQKMAIVVKKLEILGAKKNQSMSNQRATFSKPVSMTTEDRIQKMNDIIASYA